MLLSEMTLCRIERANLPRVRLTRWPLEGDGEELAVLLLREIRTDTCERDNVTNPFGAGIGTVCVPD